MALAKQAKALSKEQFAHAAEWILHHKRNGLRNQTIFYCSLLAGMRACEIANLDWSMVTDAEGVLTDELRITNGASKGKRGGRVIPIAPKLKANLLAMQNGRVRGPVFTTQTGDKVRSLYIVQLFKSWYADLGYSGCSSHSGRRTFITNAARNIGKVGGSIRDVQLLAGHANLKETERYIVANEVAMRAVVCEMQ